MPDGGDGDRWEIEPTGLDRLRLVARRAVVWVVGLLISGELHHGYTAYELRRLDADYVLGNLAGLGLVLAAGYWLVFVVPDDIALVLVGVPVGVVAVRGVLFGSIAVTAWVVALADDLYRGRYGSGFE